MRERIAVVGLGRLGTCLVRGLMRAGAQVTGLAGRDLDHTLQRSEVLGLSSVVTTVGAVARHADYVFLAVPDVELPAVAAQLDVGPGQSVVHCSGALDVTPLMAASARGAACGVFHPLQSFGPDAPAEHFRGVALGIDADAELFPKLVRLADQLGARPFSLRGVDRARYHAAAVFASNYLVALHAAAARVWESAGLPPQSARTALATLSRGAVENIAAHELASALTGPVARGDAATVCRHLAALREDAGSTALYRGLARELLALPLALSAEQRAALERALADPEPAER